MNTIRWGWVCTRTAMLLFIMAVLYAWYLT